ncbi:uncharacterized protein LOC141533651 isoform X2 [Cotesia typhae]
MSESEEKAQLVDYDSDGCSERTSSSLENVGQDPTLKIKIEKNMDTLHSLSQFHKGLIHLTDKNNAGPSKTTDENKEEQELQVKMNNFSTPVKPDQSTNKDEGILNKTENTKAKIVSCEKMVMIGNKEFEDMKMLMVESNKQTREMSATLGRAAKRLEEVTHELVKALKMTVDGRRAKLDRETAKIEATKVKDSHIVPNISDKTQLDATNGNNNITKELNLVKDALLLNQNKIKIRREYKLTQKSNYNIWFDYLKSELTSCDLLDVIDENNSKENNLPNSIIHKRKCLVRDIIINHLDEDYHKKILDISEPVEVLKRIKACRKEQINLTSSSVRKRLYLIKMKKNEKVNDFCERFDQIIREYESCGDGEQLIEQEIRSAFYQAITPINPQLMSADFIKRSHSKEMTINEMKSFILQLEAEKKTNDGEETIKAQTAKVDGKKNCHSCAKPGHKIENCPLSKDLWFCYYCQDIRSHKGSECKDGRIKSKIINNNNIKFRGKLDRQGTNRVRHNVNSKPYKNDRRDRNYNKNNQYLRGTPSVTA